MFETVGVLIVFFILLGMGIVFYYNMQQQSILEAAEEQAQLRSVSIAQQVSFLPELECSRNGVPEENCIDLIKLQKAYPHMRANMAQYYDLFLHSKITLEKIYPSPQIWQIYDSPSPEAVQDPRGVSTKRIFVPISLYDPSQDTYSYAVMDVAVYS